MSPLPNRFHDEDVLGGDIDGILYGYHHKILISLWDIMMHMQIGAGTRQR